MPHDQQASAVSGSQRRRWPARSLHERAVAGTFERADQAESAPLETLLFRPLLIITEELVGHLRRHEPADGVDAKAVAYSGSAHSDVWQEARALVFTKEQVKSSLVARPYDLRHAALSLWLNVGVPATEVAMRAGNSVEVLHRVYVKCVDGQRASINGKINDALNE